MLLAQLPTAAVTVRPSSRHRQGVTWTFGIEMVLMCQDSRHKICVTQVYDVHTVALQSLLKVAGCWSLLCVTGFWLPGCFVLAVTPVLIMPWCGSRNLVKMSLQWWLAAWWLDTDV